MLSLILIASALAVYCWLRLKAPISKLPGPLYTKITSLPLKYHEFTGTRRTWIHSLHQRYGTAVRLAPNEASFSSQEAMKEIYTSQGAGYDRTEFYDLFRQFSTRTLFSTPPKHAHGQRKRVFADRYANTNIVRPEMLSALQARARLFLRNCLQTRSSNDGGCDPDIYVQLHSYALDGASHFLFAPRGTNSLDNVPADVDILKEQMYHDSLVDNLIAHYWPALGDFLDRFKILQARPSPLANAYVIDASEQPSPAEYSLIAKLQARKADLKDGVDDVESQMAGPAECMDHLAAGIDTTGDGLCFIMYALSVPEAQGIQDKLREELVQSASSGSEQQLSYLDAVIREGLRCFPPIPMSFPRYVPSGGRKLEGYYVPEKTIVSCQPWTLHRDPVVFPDPEVFRPERWLDDEGKMERDRMFFAFSQGSRGCIGKNLAMAEMRALLKEVYSQCRTTVSKHMKGDMGLADQIISSRPSGQTCLLAFERV
ncbi:hypothetical protein AAFC00_000921 [Neodothiora populina]|uniref:Cytochrome P450 n=1 Tax=Neodothiora populina TaxID=2781224 RepID=A0ABR3PM66_9PEZI